MSLVVAVSEGAFEFRFEDSSKNETFSPTRDGLRRMALALEELGAPESVLCSSSVDFPEDDGMPADFPAGEFVGVAVSLAREGLIAEMDSEDIRPHVARVVLEH
jgi:hypothetical protein